MRYLAYSQLSFLKREYEQYKFIPSNKRQGEKGFGAFSIVFNLLKLYNAAMYISRKGYKDVYIAL
jgi:hypothetical protein